MLTQKQHLTYKFIRRYIIENGISPTDAEIAENIGIQSRGVVHRYVIALINAGLITTTPGRKRNISLVEKVNSKELELPILGKIAAGRPIDAVQESQYLDLKKHAIWK